MNEKLTKIEAVIREVCPELQKLSFGCEIITDKWTYNGSEIITGTNHGERKSFECVFRGRTEISPADVKEIIGHPIHLENILRAINKEGYKNGFMNDIFHSIGSNGQIVMISVGDIFEELCVFDLTKPLHLQSDEFISWLYGVLVGE